MRGRVEIRMAALETQWVWSKRKKRVQKMNLRPQNIAYMEITGEHDKK